jgi:hypothetical protein
MVPMVKKGKFAPLHPKMVQNGCSHIPISPTNTKAMPNNNNNNNNNNGAHNYYPLAMECNWKFKISDGT